MFELVHDWRDLLRNVRRRGLRRRVDDRHQLCDRDG
jgi:hypothetical protein